MAAPNSPASGPVAAGTTYVLPAVNARLSNMFQEMFTGVDGDGPMGGSGALKVWRSFAIDQFAKDFAKKGGIGIAPMVYDTILKEQGLSKS